MLTEEQKNKIDYLSQYKYLGKDIDRRLKDIEIWNSRATNITATLSDLPKSNNREDVISKAVAKIDEIEQEFNNDINKLVILRKDIENKIEAVDNRILRNILRDRYLYDKTWEEIAYVNGYTWRHVYRLHEKALDEIEI